MTTHVHFQHVAQDIIPKLIAGESGQLIRDSILPLTSYELVVLLFGLLLGTHTVVIFNEERITRLIAGPGAHVIHGESRYWKTGVKKKGRGEI